MKCTSYGLSLDHTFTRVGYAVMRQCLIDLGILGTVELLYCLVAISTCCHLGNVSSKLACMGTVGISIYSQRGHFDMLPLGQCLIEAGLHGHCRYIGV